ncbi:hypothetical protein Esti_001030 [Eimeria stiedai]
MQKPSQRSLFAAYEQDAQGQSDQEKQQQDEENLAWLSCGKSFDPTVALQYPGLTERQRELQQQQQSFLLEEYAAEKAAKERLAQAEAALVAGEISLERDEREHRKQLRLRQQKAQQQQDDYEGGISGRPCQGLEHHRERQQQLLGIVPASGRRRESGSSSDESVILIEPSSAVVSSSISINIRSRKQSAASRGGGGVVSPSVLKALDEGEAKRPSIWDSHRMQSETAPVGTPPHRTVSRQQQPQKARGLAAEKRQHGALSSSSSSSSRNVAAEARQREATSFAVDRRHQRKAAAAVSGAGASTESSVGQDGVFSVFVEGLEAPLVFAAGADSRADDDEAALASSSDDGGDGVTREERLKQQQQQEELLLLQQQDRLLMLCRQKPRCVELWVQLVVLQEQQLLLQQPLLLSAVSQEQLLLRQQDVLDVACSGALDSAATAGTAAAPVATGAPPALLVLRRLLLLRQTKTPLSDHAWLRTASLVGKLTTSFDCSSSSSSKTNSATALARSLCSSAAVTPQFSEPSLRLLLSQLLTSAAECLTAAARGEGAATVTRAAPTAAKATAADAPAASPVEEYRTCFALLQELLFGFSLPLEVRAGRVVAAATTAQAVAHLALLHVLQNQQLQQDQGGLVRQVAPLDNLQEIWTGRADSCGGLRAGELGWQEQLQQLQQSASEPAAAVYLQLCAAVDAIVTATRATWKTMQEHVLQSTAAFSLGGCSKDSDPGSSDSSNDRSGSSGCTDRCCSRKGLQGFAAYCVGDLALSASAWRSRIRGCVGGGIPTAAAVDVATAAAESAAAAGNIAAAAAIAAAGDARKVGEAAAAANAAAAAAAAKPSSAALDGLRRAADAAAAAAGAATRSAMAARTAAAAAAAADLKLPSPYGTSGESMSARKQWDLLRPSLLTADAVLSAAAEGVSCCGRMGGISKAASHASAGRGAIAATPLRRAAYYLLIGILDSLGSPTLHRFPSGHPRMLRGDTASGVSTDGAKLRSVVLQLRQNLPPGGDKAGSSVSDSSDSSSSNSAAAFSFWWPSSSLTSAGGDSLLQRQTRAAACWTLAQRQLRRAVLSFQQQQQHHGQQQHQNEQPRQLEDDGDELSLASSAEDATTCQALASLLCAQALLAFPDDRLLLYCLLCLCPSPKMFRLVLKRNEAEPALWLTFASSLFFQGANKFHGDHGPCSSSSATANTSGTAAADKKSPQALLLQGRKVLLTCCGAFVAHAPLATSWAFLELTVGAAVPAAAAVAVMSSNQQQKQPQQHVQAAATACLPPLLRYGWPWACWVGAVDNSSGMDSSSRSNGTQQGMALTRLPFEGWGVSVAGVHVALCSSDRSFHAFDPLQPGIPQEQQQQQQQQQPTEDEAETESALVGSFRRSHLAASCAVLLQRSRIAPPGTAAVAAAAASAFPLLTSAPWANLFLALLLHAALSPTPAAVWELFKQHRGAAAAASAAAAAAVDGSSCCVCCCGCFLSNTNDASKGNSSSSSSTGDSGSSSGLRLFGLCSRAEAARCEELFLGFVLVLLLTLSRTSDEAAHVGCALAAAETADRAAAAAQDLEVLLCASRWMLQRFTSNPFFLAVHSQLLLRSERGGGRRRLRCLYTDLLRGPPWPAVSGAVGLEPASEEPQWRPWPSAATLEAAFLSEWLLARHSDQSVSLEWQGRYAQWASSSSALPFAALQRLPEAPDGMPCATAVLQREQHLWLYLQALLLSSSSMSSYPYARRDALEASLASLDGSLVSWLCEGLCLLEEQQSQGQPQQSRTREERQQKQQQEMSELEERLLQAVSQCPFSKRLWLLLLHVLHVKRRLAGAAAETALTGGPSAAEEIVLLLDEALQRGLFFHADPLAALAAP